ncbi:hypothetical protein GW860_12780 [bacterium]|nr:hypothetical protein [bacterium]
MTGKKGIYSWVTAFLDRGLSRGVMDALIEAGVSDFSRAAGRCIVREEKGGLLSLVPGRDLTEDPIDIISFMAEAKSAPSMLTLIIETGGLATPGRGSVFCEEIRLLRSHESFAPSDLKPPEEKEEKIEQIPLARTRMTGICCIVQNGQGNRVGRIALDTGVCVPSIHLGYGTGVRDKMGLLRIAIPAEKEIITFISRAHDADTVMELMIEAGKLDQPGKGFIFSFPLKQGLQNIKVSRGERQHAASIDQIVAAIDGMKGGSEWRERTNILTRNGIKKRSYLKGLADMTLICDEGFSADLIKAAMSAGAGGATVSRFKQSAGSESEQGRRAASREMCSMAVSEASIPGIMEALEKAGAFSDECRGQVFVRPIEKAFTYVRRK